MCVCVCSVCVCVDKKTNDRIVAYPSIRIAMEIVLFKANDCLLIVKS